jgi:hypothetical protein
MDERMVAERVARTAISGVKAGYGEYPGGGKSVQRLYAILRRAGIRSDYRFEEQTSKDVEGAWRSRQDLQVEWEKHDGKYAAVRFGRVVHEGEDAGSVEFTPYMMQGIRASWRMGESYDYNVTHNSMVNAVKLYVKEAAGHD